MKIMNITYMSKLEKWFPLQGERAHVLLLPFQSSYPAQPTFHVHFLGVFFFFFSGSHSNTIFTPHTQLERGKVIDRGVHIYMSVVKKKI